jgi:AcrR family transcriptional regulator
MEAAAAVLAESGYDAATMTDIAQRADASIGALYRFFPNKLSIAQALRGHYTKQFHVRWAPLKAEAKHMTVAGLAERLIVAMADFVDSYPAFLVLLEVPASTQGSATIRRDLFRRVEGLILARSPRIARAKASRFAIVTLNIMGTLAHVYAGASQRERPVYVNEFKILLARYLEARIGNGAASRRKA